MKLSRQIELINSANAVLYKGKALKRVLNGIFKNMYGEMIVTSSKRTVMVHNYIPTAIDINEIKPISLDEYNQLTNKLT